MKTPYKNQVVVWKGAYATVKVVNQAGSVQIVLRTETKPASVYKPGDLLCVMPHELSQYALAGL